MHVEIPNDNSHMNSKTAAKRVHMKSQGNLRYILQFRKHKIVYTKCCSSNEQSFNEEIDMKQCSAYGMVVSTQTETGQHNSNVYDW